MKEKNFKTNRKIVENLEKNYFIFFKVDNLIKLN